MVFAHVPGVQRALVVGAVRILRVGDKVPVLLPGKLRVPLGVADGIPVLPVLEIHVPAPLVLLRLAELVDVVPLLLVELVPVLPQVLGP